MGHVEFQRPMRFWWDEFGFRNKGGGNHMVFARPSDRQPPESSINSSCIHIRDFDYYAFFIVAFIPSSHLILFFYLCLLPCFFVYSTASLMIMICFLKRKKRGKRYSKYPFLASDHSHALFCYVTLCSQEFPPFSMY